MQQPDDDDWTLRTSALGEDVVEVTLTLGSAARHRQTTVALIVAAAAALLVSLLPLPPLTAAAGSAAAAAAPLLPPLLHELLPQRGASAGIGASASVGALTAAIEVVARLALLYAVLAALPQPVVQESVVALRGLGVQLRTVRRGGAASVTFFDAAHLRALVVNEGIQRCSVRYYLALVVAGRATLLLLFDHARPRLPAIGSIYRSLLTVLFPDVASGAADRYLRAVEEET